MNRGSILAEAHRLIYGPRAQSYGDARESFGRLARLWGAYTGHSYTPADVAVMLTLLKISRLRTDPGKVDSWADAAGYIALGGEIATGGPLNDKGGM